MRKNFGVKTYICPQPVLIIATYDENGAPNAMNAAWGCMYDYDEIFISVAEHKTTKNIEINKAFTVSFGTKEMVEACDYVGIVSGNKEPNKFQKAGFTAIKSEFVNAPIINELPIGIECVLSEKSTKGNLIGKIINVSADEKYLGEDGLPDLSKFVPLTFDPVHNKYVALGEVVGDAFSIGNKLK